jgi:hypothetical protein
VLLEKIQNLPGKLKHPLCIDGAQKCPPENIGGIHGYFNMLEILSAKRHPEKKELLEWLGGPFDPGEFEKTSVNKELELLDEYIKEWLDSSG